MTYHHINGRFVPASEAGAALFHAEMRAPVAARLAALRTEAETAECEMGELGYPRAVMTDEALAQISERVTARLAETAAADRKALRLEDACAAWERSEGSSDSDPYFQGGFQ